MITRARSKYVRISPKKANEVARLVRGERLDQALATVQRLNRRSARFIGQTLLNALANVSKELSLTESDLYISRITVDGGPVLKRYRAEPMGRASVIRKPTSHIIVELDMVKRKK